MNDTRQKSMVDLRQETEANSQYIRGEGFNLVEMWECEWRRLKKSNPILKQFLASRFHRPLDNCWRMTEAQILTAVRDESLFGVIECDIKVPELLKDRFSEMCPIFKNTDISIEDIGDFMKSYAEEHDIMRRPRRSLIGSLKGDKILLATPLLKWYLEHGLEVTKVYQVVEYTPKPCFKTIR